jgi:hypothetical protein
MQIPLGHFQPNRLTGTNIVLRAKDAQKHQLEETDDQYAEILSVLIESLEVRTRLLRLAAGAPPWPWIDPEKAAPWVAGQLGLAFAERVAVQAALASKVLVITGGDRRGQDHDHQRNLAHPVSQRVKLLLCAPTGHAAKRMTEATGFEAKTIPRLLEADPKGGG